MIADVIIVGSGASATSAARTLADSGTRVCILDVGNRESRYADAVPPLPFERLRREDPSQHRYLLGDDFEGVPIFAERVGAQLTPPRRFIRRDTETLTPLLTDTFSRLESLAWGGMASGWGGVALQWNERDLADFPIRAAELLPHYESVSAWIGLSGARDDLLEHYGNPRELDPPPRPDANARRILERYAARRDAIRRLGVSVGCPRLALLTRDRGSRGAQAYRDMDFYSDGEGSVFRPAHALEDLSARPGFRVLDRRLVERFEELPRGEGVRVHARNLETDEREEHVARRLILCAGSLGTARIVLRSLGRHDTPVPLVSNPYTYVPCLHLAMLGRKGDAERHSLTQVGMVLDPPGGGPVVHAQIYSYRSLLLFRIAKESPLAFRESLRILREIEDAFVIVGIHHEDRPSPEKHCILRHGAGGAPDTLEIRYASSGETLRRQRDSERTLLRALWKLGCLPLKFIHPGNGASLHYGGTIPMSLEERELTVTPRCLLRGTGSVYLADGSVFPYLPAKALTLSLMANAERVAGFVRESLGGGT